MPSKSNINSKELGKPKPKKNVKGPPMKKARKLPAHEKKAAKILEKGEALLQKLEHPATDKLSVSNFDVLIQQIDDSCKEAPLDSQFTMELAADDDDHVTVYDKLRKLKSEMGNARLLAKAHSAKSGDPEGSAEYLRNALDACSSTDTPVHVSYYEQVCKLKGAELADKPEELSDSTSTDDADMIKLTAQ